MSLCFFLTFWPSNFEKQSNGIQCQEKMRLQGVGDQEFKQYGMEMLTPAQLSNMAGNSFTTQTSSDGINTSKKYDSKGGICCGLSLLKMILSRVLKFFLPSTSRFSAPVCFAFLLLAGMSWQPPGEDSASE